MTKQRGKKVILVFLVMVIQKVLIVAKRMPDFDIFGADRHI